MADIVAGNDLPASVCRCQDASYCSLVAAGSFAVGAQVSCCCCCCWYGNSWQLHPGDLLLDARQAAAAHPWHARTGAGWCVQALSAVQAVGGDLSPLPFQSLLNATQDQLKCFQGGLGQATDTYNVSCCCASHPGVTLGDWSDPRTPGLPCLQIYLVAASALPTFNGLAPQCSNLAQAVATAAAATSAAAATAGTAGTASTGCPAAPHISCAQSQQQPDSPILQSGGALLWPLSADIPGGSYGGSSNISSAASPLVVWQPPAGASVFGRPSRVELSLEGGAAPAFTLGPLFPPALRTATSFGLEFALDEPALLIYAGRWRWWCSVKCWGAAVCPKPMAAMPSPPPHCTPLPSRSVPPDAHRLERHRPGAGADRHGARARV